MEHYTPIIRGLGRNLSHSKSLLTALISRPWIFCCNSLISLGRKRQKQDRDSINIFAWNYEQEQIFLYIMSFKLLDHWSLNCLLVAWCISIKGHDTQITSCKCHHNGNHRTPSGSSQPSHEIFFFTSNHKQLYSKAWFRSNNSKAINGVYCFCLESNMIHIWRYSTYSSLKKKTRETIGTRWLSQQMMKK